MPQPGERATIGVVDLASGSFEPVATTAARTLQQGAMLHWLPPGGPTSPDAQTTLSPDRRRLVFDGGQDDAGRLLRLYDDLTGAVTVLGHCYAAPQFRGDIRCDLHPRRNRSGTQVCVDSVHGGDRQVYVVDLALDAGHSGHSG